jgi:integrase
MSAISREHSTGFAPRAHKAEKVRPLHFHCARHTFASWALEAGRSIKWVQATLGHASAEITLRPYSHLTPLTDNVTGQGERLVSPSISDSNIEQGA